MIEKNCCIIYLKNSFISLFKRFLFLYIVIQWESIIKWNKPLFHQPAKVHSFYITTEKALEISLSPESTVLKLKPKAHLPIMSRARWARSVWIDTSEDPSDESESLSVHSCRHVYKKIIKLKLKLHHFSWEEWDTVNPLLSPPLIPCMFECGAGGGDSIERECFFIFTETRCFSAF